MDCWLIAIINIEKRLTDVIYGLLDYLLLNTKGYNAGGIKMNIALIAHDKNKKDMVQFTHAYQPYLVKHALFATGTTGKLIHEKTGLDIKCFRSGPLGGDQEIGAMVAKNEIDMVIFFRDPLTAQPHEPDISALLRLCDVYNIPLATNMGSAEILVRALERGDIEWRYIVHDNKERELEKKNLLLKGIQSHFWY